MPVALGAVLSDLDRRAEEPLALGGYSMGGRLALHYALTRPARVRRLILVGASPGIADAAARAARRRSDERLAQEIERLPLEDFAERWARTPILAGQPAEVAARAHADRLRCTPSGLARALRGLGPGTLPPLWHQLGELSMPVLLIVGEYDHKYREIAQRMVQALPDGRLEVIAGAGHAVHLERPAAVAALIAGR